MKTPEWRSYFSPQEWSIFNREAARRGLSADELAAKYLCRALDRIELAEQHGAAPPGGVTKAIQNLSHGPRRTHF